MQQLITIVYQNHSHLEKTVENVDHFSTFVEQLHANRLMVHLIVLVLLSMVLILMLHFAQKSNIRAFLKSHANNQAQYLLTLESKLTGDNIQRQEKYDEIEEMIARASNELVELIKSREKSQIEQMTQAIEGLQGEEKFAHVANNATRLADAMAQIERLAHASKKVDFSDLPSTKAIVKLEKIAAIKADIPAACEALVMLVEAPSLKGLPNFNRLPDDSDNRRIQAVGKLRDELPAVTEVFEWLLAQKDLSEISDNLDSFEHFNLKPLQEMLRSISEIRRVL